MRPTLADIAREARVSPATVDRVMNDRPGVAARTRAQVMAAAHALGYLGNGFGPAIAPVKIALILPAGTNAFIRSLSTLADTQAAAMPSVSIETVWSDGLDPSALAHCLTAVDADALAVVALAHPVVREAIRQVAARGRPVVTLASDIPGTPRLAYIGIDNGQAGRLAGAVTGRFLGPEPKGKVALIAGSLAYRGHQEREMGFRQILAEEFSGLDILSLRESGEDRGRAEAEMRRLLDDHPDLAAIYNAGGGTIGVARALQAAGAARRVVFVAHEITDDNTGLILDGTLDAVIDQAPGTAIREALSLLAATARGETHRLHPPRLQLVLRENLPGR